MPSLVITTGLRSDTTLENLALELSRELQAPFIAREKHSLQTIREMAAAEAVFLVKKDQLALVVEGKELFFHPGLAKLRIKELQSGKADQMIEAMGLQKGNSVLDCTLGLASDALVASYICGPSGTVVGLEDSRAVAEIVGRGLKSYQGEKPEMLAAMRRIKVLSCHHLEFLRKQPDNAFDVVYFDPMFRHPREQSSSMASLRPLANRDPLSAETVAEALRVAGKKVVMKENRNSQEFQRLSFPTVVGGKYSPVAYGIIEKGGAGCRI